MKKTILGGICLLACAFNANADQLSNKAYVGFTLGPTIPKYKSNYVPIWQARNKPNDFSFNTSVLIGRTFTNYGFEASLTMLNYQSYKESYYVLASGRNTKRYTAFDLMFAGDFIYYIPLDANLSFKLNLGIGLIESLVYTKTKSDLPSTNSSDSYGLKFAPKGGIGLRYALNDQVSTNFNINYVAPIEHIYLNKIIYANLGINIHF